MGLEEMNMLNSWHTEEELIKIVQLIEDKIIFKGYSEQELIVLANKLMEINLLSLKYEGREEILNTLCSAVAYYGIREKIDLKKIQDIKYEVENDLKEYILELLG